MTADLTPALARLADFDTPTICNALEVVAPERRATGFTHAPLVCAHPSLPPMVGLARTGTIAARDKPHTQASAVAATRRAYYRYVAEGDTPRVVVLEDRDRPAGFGAFWGEVNTTIHKGLGCLGVVTNGSIRDLPDSAPGFQLLAGNVGPSHGWVRVEAFGMPVNVNGMAVEHDDIIHADLHGAVVVPREVLAELPAALDLVTRREAPILAAARSPEFSIEMLERALDSAAEIH